MADDMRIQQINNDINQIGRYESDRNLDRKIQHSAPEDSGIKSDDDVLKNEYGNVISTSEDGDTVRATKESEMSAALDGKLVVASEDGFVTERNSDKKNVIAEEEEKISDLTGMTAQQVETLYRQGKVSYSDYTKDVEKRDELKEAMNPSDEDDEKITGVTADEEKSSIAPLNKDEEKTPAAPLNNDEKEETEASKVNEESKDKSEMAADVAEKQKELIGEFDKTMGVLNAADNNRELENIALNTAIKNGDFENIKNLGLV